MAKKQEKVELSTLSLEEKAKIAADLGNAVAKIMNDAKAKAQKHLEKYGYGCNVHVDFFELEKDESNQAVKQ